MSHSIKLQKQEDYSSFQDSRFKHANHCFMPHQPYAHWVWCIEDTRQYRHTSYGEKRLKYLKSPPTKSVHSTVKCLQNRRYSHFSSNLIFQKINRIIPHFKKWAESCTSLLYAPTKCTSKAAGIWYKYSYYRTIYSRIFGHYQCSLQLRTGLRQYGDQNIALFLFPASELYIWS